MRKVKVGVLGATGMVGQRFMQLLAGHPWFEVTELAASERSAGKPYEEAVGDRWKIGGEIPDFARGKIVKECKPGLDCDLVFSALDSSVAGLIEEELAMAGYPVCSNSRNHRMDPDVPLLVPEINHDHLEAIKGQKLGDGFIVTNPNCSTIGLVIPLKPLLDSFGLKRVFVTTMQALSGAGFKGFDLDIQDNVLPYIGGEEEKMEMEPLKILGRFEKGRFLDAGLGISAQCNRVNVQNGHLETVNVELGSKAGLDDVISSLKGFNPLEGFGLPSAPNPPIIVKEEDDRPQPKYDRDAGEGISELARGMAVTVGRVRECRILDYKFVLLSHNTIRGAAGASILNAELMLKKGMI
ncbi:MAG: aspartate-semialdehyde dehydrogenase [Candidatus Aenigmarchaeota archaeon]|nr:aspartate-semialdehyde dehydrogenase [Candidatus Aenigmarchaeota archaeon]